MFRNDDPTAASSLPTPGAPGTPGYFIDGNPVTATPATIVTQDFMNSVQEELMAPVLAAALTPSKTNNAQLLAAIPILSGNLAGFSNLKGSAAGGTATAAWTVSELIAETALGGLAYKGAGLSLNFNGAGTGAGGMDTGAIPSAGDLSIYAIYKPSTNTWNTLGCLGSTSNGRVYTGANMPAGYTASVLIWVGVTASSHISKFAQADRLVMIPSAIVVNSSGYTATPSSVNLSSVIAAAVKWIAGTAGVTSSVSNTVFISADSTGQLGEQEVGATIPSSGCNGNFGPLLLATAQTMWVNIAGGTATVGINISSYGF